jgi:hypothetical protein
VRLGSDPDDAAGFLSGLGFVRGLLTDLDRHTAAAALDRLNASLTAYHTRDGGALWIGCRLCQIACRVFRLWPRRGRQRIVEPRSPSSDWPTNQPLDRGGGPDDQRRTTRGWPAWIEYPAR